MKSKKYWEKRFEQLEESLYKKTLDVANNNKTSFDLAEKKINEQIAIWYQRFAKNNEVSMSNAKKLLNSDELEELKWDVSEYIKYGRENALNQKWMKELENASAKFHISRLEALRIRVRNTVEQLYNSEEELINTHLEDTYKSSYYHNHFEIQKGFGVGFDIGTIDLEKLKKVLSTPWAADEKNFSDRIWQSKSQLINELNNELTTMCLLGKAPDEAIRNISKKLNVSRAQAGRLVMTESAFISSAAQKDCFNSLDVENYEILATLDFHTSVICRSMDSKVFPMSEYQIGVTAPPFHPNCRTTTIPSFDDDYDISTRAARDENGKTCYVSANMKYSEWKRKYVNTNVSKNYKDVTKEWLNKATPNSHTVKDRQYFEYKGTRYKVDNKNVVLDYSNHEKEVAQWLENTFGGEIYMLPRVNKPDGISTADYLFQNEYWDLKDINGKGKNVLFHAVEKHENQAHNFIFDVTNSKLKDEEILNRLEKLYLIKKVKWLDKIIIKRNNKIVSITKKSSPSD